MSQLATVTSLYRYPVKSMLGDALESARLTELGIVGDRAWGVRDETRGDFMTGKRVAALMDCRARYVDDRIEGGVPEIELPKGDVLRADDPDAGKRLSEVLGRPVSLCPIGATPDSGDPERLLQEFDAEAESRAMMAREGDEPMPDFSNLPAAVFEFFARPGRPYFDALPLLILSEQSLSKIAAAAQESKVDVRRFRPSILVDAKGDDELPEQAWVGRRLKIGDAIVSVVMTCARCVMTTHGFAELPKDPMIMRKLVSEAEGNLGVYASVEQAGALRSGDAVELLD